MRKALTSNRFLVLLVGLFIAAGGSAAWATGNTSTSAPKGDLTVSTSLSSATDRDRDGNPDTATGGDSVTATSTVTNNTVEIQTVTVTYTLDAPGEQYDSSYSQQVTLGPGASETESVTYKVTGRFPEGLYRLTTSASGTESTSAAASITVH